MRTSHLTFLATLLLLVLTLLFCSQVSAQSGYFVKNIQLTMTDRDLLSMINRVVVDGQYAYCEFSWGIQVLDISNPAVPIKVGECATPDGEFSQTRYMFGDMFKFGDYLLIGKYLFNVGSPNSPVFVKEFWEFGLESSMASVGNYLYLLVGSSVRIYDLSDPETPSLAATWQITSEFGIETAVDIAISNGHLYLATVTHSPMVIADISNPLSPVTIGSAPLGPARGIISASGNYVCLGFQGYGPMEVFDVSNPSSPRSLGEYTSQSFIVRIAIDGDKAYCIRGIGGIEVVQLSQSAPPASLSMRLPPDGNPYVGAWNDVLVANGMVIIARSDVGLEFLDPSVDVPTVIGQYQSHDYAKEVISDGSYLYVVSWRVGLRIFSLTDPQHPELVATLPVMRATSIALAGNAVYLGRRTDGIFNIVDVSDPTHPVMADSVYITGYVEDMVVNDGRLFVVDRYQGLRIYSLINPFAPVEQGQIVVGQGISVAVSGDVAVFNRATYPSATYYVDVSNPSAPVVRGMFPTYQSALGNLTTDGRYTYAIYDGLHIFDMVDPTHIVEVASLGSYDMNQTEGMTASNADGSLILSSSGNYLWVVHSSGLSVYNVHEKTRPKFADSYRAFSYAGSGMLIGDKFYMAQELGLTTLQISFCCNGTTGDINMDGQVDLSDLSWEVNYITQNGYPNSFICGPSANVDSHGTNDLSDLSLLIAYMVGAVHSLPSCL